jgi:hypothetical protein
LLHYIFLWWSLHNLLHDCFFFTFFFIFSLGYSHSSGRGINLHIQ